MINWPTHVERLRPRASAPSAHSAAKVFGTRRPLASGLSGAPAGGGARRVVTQRPAHWLVVVVVVVRALGL